MPYILSPPITEDMQGMWFEGAPYESKIIYSIDGTPPPINYQQHTIKSHSLTHIEGSLHTQKRGKSVDKYFSGNYFFGKAKVVKLKGDNYKLVDPAKKIYHWEVSLDELKEALGGQVPEKLLLSTEKYFVNKDGFHDPDYVLTLSLEAAEWLVSSKNFKLYGTSWKSSDYMPGSMQRPIHDKLFECAAIMECLDLKDVPEGEYFLVSYPLRIVGASESPVVPVLFTKDEILNSF